jgi:hypothetical protein
MLLLEDLWAKTLGRGVEGKAMATDDQIFDMIDKTCGKGGVPVPFRGAYHLPEHPETPEAFKLARRADEYGRITIVDPNTVPADSWEAEALKASCQDFVASMETNISEQFYETVRGLDLKDKAVASRLQDDGMPLVGRLCEQRCAKAVVHIYVRLLVSSMSRWSRPQLQRVRCSCAAPKKKKTKKRKKSPTEL